MLGFLLLGALAVSSTNAGDVAKPNIIWVVVEDMSAHFGCYGEKAIATPNLDQLAIDGTRFSHAFVTGPICSISRSAMITGMYQTSIGAQHHRSGRGTVKINLPKEVVPVPALFQQAGYHTSNCAFPQIAKGKTDYNFEFNPKIYDGNDWANRKNNQPFFSQIQMHGGKYREGKNWTDLALKELGKLTDPKSPLIKLPPYYPNDPVILNDWAAYLDTIRLTDKLLGQLIQRLKNEKVYDNTILFFWTDHGISHARGKQFLYEEGIHVPLVVHGPKIASNKVRDDLVEHIDITASSLAFAGIPIPASMQGKNIFVKDYKPREFVFSARDRADETVEHIRSARSKNFKYLRNYLNERPHLQPNGYKDGKQILVRMKELFNQGKLDSIQSQIYATKRPREELYDLRNDPWEIENLASDAKYSAELERHRKALADWEIATNDLGRIPETEAQYDSDMEVYLGPKKGDQKNAILLKNIRQMKQWTKEGK